MTMKTRAIGIRAVSATTPSVIRDNDYFRATYPDVVARADQHRLSNLWRRGAESPPGAEEFDAAMQRYVDDPFRGTVERRRLGPGESSITLEHLAARQALAAANLRPGEVDLMIVSSFLPERTGPGNAPYVARELGLNGHAFNLESACASSLVAVQTATALLQAGAYRNALVVVSCTYSRTTDESDTLSWFLGDGAGAFVLGEVEPGRGVLGSAAFHTGETCGVASFYVDAPPGVEPRFRQKWEKDAGRVLRESSAPTLRKCCLGAVRDAGLTMDDISLLVFNNPTAWFAEFGARVLGVDPERTISTFPLYANIGPALTPTNLHHAALTGRLKRDDLVLVYAVGSVSSAAASVIRWGDVALGPAQAPPLRARCAQSRAHLQIKPSQAVKPHPP
jgi:3-oxoacyl-[acyl-carrier-protein] synthase III